MKHYATPRFWRCHEALPKEARDLADRSYALLKADPTHRSLHFKRIGLVCARGLPAPLKMARWAHVGASTVFAIRVSAQKRSSRP